MKPEEDQYNPQAWLERARGNLSLAQGGQYLQGIFLEDLCFNAQQAAEKAFKAICVHLDLDFPKTHSLVGLMDVIEFSGKAIPDEVRQAAILTQYAVRSRYPGWIEPVNREGYLEALKLAQEVVAWAEKLVAGDAE